MPTEGVGGDGGRSAVAAVEASVTDRESELRGGSVPKFLYISRQPFDIGSSGENWRL